MLGTMLIFAAAPLMLGAASAEQASLADARCLIALTQIPESKDAATAAALQSATLYYAGRIDGRAPAVDLKTLFVRAMTDLKPEDLGPTLTRCGELMQQRGAVYQEIGRAMQAETPAAK